MRLPLRHLLLTVLVIPLSVATARAQSRSLDDYALFATEQLRSKGMTVTAGDVGVNLGSLFAHGVISASSSTLVADSARLAPGSNCAALFAGTLVASSPACGPETPFTGPIIDGDVGEACGFPAPFPGCTSANGVVLSGGITRTLPPGSYGDVLLTGGGGGSSTLILRGGEYQFCTVRVSRGSRMLVDSASQVFVSGDLRLSPLAQLIPTAASGVTPADVHLFVNGANVRASRGATLDGRVCAPTGTLGATRGATLDGSFVARRIRVDGAVVKHTGFGPHSTTSTTSTSTSTTVTTTSSSTSSSTSTTTTTSIPGDCPQRCGNGVVDTVCHEQCDIGSAESSFVSDECPSCDQCRCVTTSSTIVTTTTSTTIPGDCPARCGNGVVDDVCGEQCDGSVRGAFEPCTACDACRCTAGTTTTTLPTHADEICGNCLDDDANDAIDFEDPACCSQAQAFSMELKRARFRPRGTASRLRLRAFLARTGMDDVNPTTEDVYLQVRTASGEALCAMIPAGKFKQRHATFKFKDKKHTVPSAFALDRVTVRVRKNHTVLFRATGRKIPVATPAAGALRITVAFRNAATAETGNRCSAVRSAEFRTGPKGSIRFP